MDHKSPPEPLRLPSPPAKSAPRVAPAADSEPSPSYTINYIISNKKTFATKVMVAQGDFDKIEFPGGGGCVVGVSSKNPVNDQIHSYFSVNLTNANSATVDVSDRSDIIIIFDGRLVDGDHYYPRRGRCGTRSIPLYQFLYATSDVETSRRLANAWSRAIALCKARNNNPSDPFSRQSPMSRGAHQP
jgi:hypothetical protein